MTACIRNSGAVEAGRAGEAARRPEARGSGTRTRREFLFRFGAALAAGSWLGRDGARAAAGGEVPSYLRGFEGAYHRSADEVWRILAEARRDRCNLLLNAGPLGDGSIHPADAATLREVGRRLKTQGWPPPAPAQPAGGEGEDRSGGGDERPAKGAASVMSPRQSDHQFSHSL